MDGLNHCEVAMLKDTTPKARSTLERPEQKRAKPKNLKVTQCSICFFACALFLGPAVASSQAQGPARKGLVVPVRRPVTSQSVNELRLLIEPELKRFERQRPNDRNNETFRLVFDFNPNGVDQTSEDWASCYALADLIHQYNSRANVHAFVRGNVRGHLVLPVLACQTLLMSEKAKLGPVLKPGAAAPNGGIHQESYRKAAQWGLRGWDELAAKLFDVNRELKQKGAAANVLFPSGTPAVFDFEKAQHLGGRDKQSFGSVHEVARALGLPRSSTLPLLPQEKVACKIVIRDEVDRKLKEKLNRLIRSAIRDKKANLIVLDLRCRGGSPADALALAKDIREIKEGSDSPVLIIGHYGPEARSTALYLAMACDYFVVHSEAVLGEFRRVLEGKSNAELNQLGARLQAFAENRGYPEKLARAFVDNTPGMERLFIEKSGTGQPRFYVPQDLARDPQLRGKVNATPVWEATDGLLSLSAARAREYGLADRVVEDVDEIFTKWGVDPNKVIEMEDDWLDHVARFLTSDWASFLLVMIGICCLILELKMPGVGLPGILAALCFVLFFWSQSQFKGEITWLAILLFILGLLLLALEIFVLPGFGICGVSGLILALGSLGLMAYGHWPHSSKEWVGFSKTLAPYGFSLMGAIVCAVFLARYLPNLPYFNRLILKPNTESQSAVSEEMDPQHARLTALLGVIGVAATPLRPAGKVQFGEEYVDVVAEGSYIVPGSRVQVIEIEGNRVVVKQV